MENLYIENKKTIEAAAKTISRKTGYDLEELRSEANLIFCECVQNFKPEKGEFNKYLSSSLFNSLFQFVNKERGFIDNTREFSSDNFYSTKEKNFYEEIALENLSSDSKYVMDIIFSDIRFITKSYKTEKVTKERLRSFLRSKGWKFTRINNTFNELSAALN